MPGRTEHSRIGSAKTGGWFARQGLVIPKETLVPTIDTDKSCLLVKVTYFVVQVLVSISLVAGAMVWNSRHSERADEIAWFLFVIMLGWWPILALAGFCGLGLSAIAILVKATIQRAFFKANRT